jgi:hypothetical protein
VGRDSGEGAEPERDDVGMATTAILVLITVGCALLLLAAAAWMVTAFRDGCDKAAPQADRHPPPKSLPG